MTDSDDLLTRNGSGPLSGQVVVDFSRVLAGPYATMMLADLGATVIKVEGPKGDDTRHWSPPARDDDSTYYLSINRNKYDIVLDFADPEDLATAQDLATRADIIVENFKPGGLAKFGLDYESVSASNPEVVYASITGFGADNPLPGYDLLVQAMSGFMSITGSPDGSPYRAGVAVFDVITGLHTTIGILAAVQHRTVTGEGQLVETNLMSSAMSGLANQTAAYAAAGVTPTRMGNAHPSLYPYQPMETKDGEIIIAAANDGQFAALAKALGRPDWCEDERFAKAKIRNAHRDELEPELLEALQAHTAQEWFDKLTAVGLPCAPINSISQGVERARDLGLDPIVETGQGERVIPTIRNPIRLSKSEVAYDLAPPSLGADSDIVRAWLRRSSDQ
ncbi:Crotonobetainyl-CoA:carnitine CoA-transferase CaiB [Brevibacterium iodinum ATCC 49514]|uniref:Crotonobetainyl-CoA:carnitine CoA-transferase CaiB n=1 Tax=Brevibacterium iodinum ATCC 49514 TaxID=1255616 RepID=A0A2H1JIW5_9MICO|nr:CoA transferase [Brevibacterium iodinum]SMX87373.1 Crotonobetainyl-CoA:carnitine CoA-transferase CaiB [Brevibacterium iodinum ATCC 49514]SUW14387.1 Formyl-coenzyme A transferase [Brevibacterium iodinum]